MVEVVRLDQGIPPQARGLSLALGNFDGLHLGHQAVIRQAQQQQKQLGFFGLATFEPHTRLFFKPDAEPFRILPLPAMIRRLSQLDVPYLVILPFGEQMARMSPAQFVDDILVGQLAISHVVIGENFRFGAKRAGDGATLKELAQGRFGVEVVKPVADGDGQICSSSMIRELIEAGDCELAAKMLGTEYELEGEVIKGRQLGRTLDMATANLRTGAYLAPRRGIYAVRATIDSQASQTDASLWWDGVASFGVRPTVEGAGAEPLLEVHLFDQKPDLYGRILRVRLTSYLREELKFDDLEALKQQMQADAVVARQRLR